MRRGSDQPVSDLARRFSDALRAGSSVQAEQVMDEALLAGVSPAAIHALVIEPAMVHIGELWESAEISVADEHLATAISHGVLIRLFDALSLAPECSRQRVLLAAVQGQHHVLGLRMVADVLEGAGFDVLFLGANARLTPCVTSWLSISRPSPGSASMSQPTSAISGTRCSRSTR
jgi:MerR family transcriptional regulator, light-induced transcriptional regulator